MLKKPKKKYDPLQPTIFSGTGNSKFAGKGRTQALAFFKRCPWAAWWQEFWTARNPDGKLKFITPYTFAKTKAKTTFQLDVIYRAIGDKPVDLPKIKDSIYREVPYLGNWQEMRKKAYFFEPSGAQYEQSKRALQEKQQSLEVLRSSSNMWFDRVIVLLKFESDIIEAFGGSPVDSGSSYAKMDKKSKTLYGILERNNEAIMRAWNLFLISIGITPTDAVQPGTTNLIMAGANSQVLQAAPSSNDPNSPALKMISEAIFDKAQIFKMGLPASIAPHQQEQQEEEEEEPREEPKPIKVVR